MDNRTLKRKDDNMATIKLVIGLLASYSFIHFARLAWGIGWKIYNSIRHGEYNKRLKSKMIHEWVIDDDSTYLKVVVTVKNIGKVKTEIEPDGTLLDLLIAPKELQHLEEAWEVIDTKSIFEDSTLTRGETVPSCVCLFQIPSKESRIYKLRSCIVSNGQDWGTEELVKYDGANILVKKGE